MHLKTRNVNTAFRDLVSIFIGDVPQGIHVPTVIKRRSRNGNVLMIDEPMTITYEKPRERVLFNAARDANPAFHLYEALWMLAGRNDVDSVVYYAKQMREYSDDGKTLNGAYGRRWRRAERYEWSDTGDAYRSEVVDQLDILVNHLKTDPNSRRAVLQMWNVEDDLLKIGPVKKYDDSDQQQALAEVMDTSVSSKDVCCNLSVMFSIRLVNYTDPNGSTFDKPFLDITVTNRSNDMIWGLLGANYVHFTFLQEYMAARLGIEVGKYHHFTNNLHVYDWNWKPEEWLNDRQQDWYGKGVIREHGSITNVLPLIRDPAVFERELPEFVEHWAKPDEVDNPFRKWEEPFLETVASPLLAAFLTYKRRGATTSAWVGRIAADDWRIAARGWIERRLNRKEKADVSE